MRPAVFSFTLGEPNGDAMARLGARDIGSPAFCAQGINRNKNGYLIMKSSNENESMHSENGVSFERW
jgi:hypothetical protein